MKYIAIVDDEFLSNFKVDIGYPNNTENILIVTDRAGYNQGIRLKPLSTEMLVTKDGKSIYLQQKHIDSLIDMERKEMLNKSVERLMNLTTDAMHNYQKIKETIKFEMSFENAKFTVDNLAGLSRALEIFEEVEDENND